MYVVASFQHSLFVELVISEIEETGVTNSQILAIPLDKRNETPRLFGSSHYADGESFLDLSLILSTMFMLMGSIYGFVLPLRPIIWALLGLVGGALIGFTIKFMILNRKKKNYLQAGKVNTTEVFIMINCPENKVKEIQQFLWAHHAHGVGQLE